MPYFILFSLIAVMSLHMFIGLKIDVGYFMRAKIFRLVIIERFKKLWGGIKRLDFIILFFDLKLAILGCQIFLFILLISKDKI